MGRVLLRGGQIITDTLTYPADILMDDGKIVNLGKGLRAEGAQVVDVAGKLVLPGGVDPHTHFDLPMFDTISSDDHYTGHKAAAFGGTTTVMDFVPQPEEGGLEAGLDQWLEKASPKAAIDFSFHMNVTRLDEAILGELPRLAARGVTSVKVFTAYNHRLRLHDGEIFRVMRQAGRQGMLTMLHAENGDVIEILVAEALAAGNTSPIWHALTRPAWGAVEATLRGIALAAQAEAPLYVVHVNTAGEVDQIRYARERYLPVMGETCPPYLFFSTEHLERPDGAKWVCSPPMRAEADNQALWQGLMDGTLQTVGTDHCPFFYDGTKPILYEGQPVQIPGKELGRHDFTKIPNGLPGVGDRLPILWTFGVGQGRMTPQQFVALTSANPARAFGLYPRKGAILPGSDADLVVWDPEREVAYGQAVAQHRTDYNLYEGWKLKGFPEQVFLRGECIVRDGSWRGRRGGGAFLERQPGVTIV
jgi:dihydropyrimidinase